MIFSDHQVRVWLHQRATDMRKSFAGLIALVKQQLQEDPLSGHLFVFINRRRTYMKVLYFAQGGFCIWSKRLTQGQFALNEAGGLKRAMTWHELLWLIEGIDVKAVRYRKRSKFAGLSRSTAIQYDHDVDGDNRQLFERRADPIGAGTSPGDRRPQASARVVQAPALRPQIGETPGRVAEPTAPH